MYFYDRDAATLFYYREPMLDEAINNGTFKTVSVKDLSEDQNQWVGKWAMDGIQPAVDFGYDQMMNEVREKITKSPDLSPEQGLAIAMTNLFDRFRANLNPTINDQRERLQRMIDFFERVSEVDLMSDFIILNSGGHILRGLPILARAILEKENTVQCCVVRLPITHSEALYTWSDKVPKPVF